MKSITAAFILSKFFWSRTTSGPTSITDLLSIKNRRTCCVLLSTAISLRGGGSNGFSESASRIPFAASWSSSGNVGRCEVRAMADPLRTKLSEQRYAISASKTSPGRSEEHTSELQSLAYLVCRLLLEKKKKTNQQ